MNSQISLRSLALTGGIVELALIIFCLFTVNNPATIFLAAFFGFLIGACAVKSRMF